MPEPPSWIDKVNYVVDFWIDPCHAPVIVYLELAVEPAGEAILAWFSFGLSDVFRGWFRPSKALSGNKRGRRGKRGKNRLRFNSKTLRALGKLKRVPGIGDDVGGWIGRQLPGANAVKGRSVSQAGRFLWFIDDISQRALLALLITDITTDFLYEWATALRESEYCQRDSKGSLYATGTGPVVGTVIFCNAISANEVKWAEEGPTWNTTGGTVPSGQWTVLVSSRCTNITAGFAEVWLRMLVSESGQPSRWVESPHTLVPPGIEVDSILYATVKGPASFVANACAFGGSCDYTRVDVNIWGGGPPS